MLYFQNSIFKYFYHKWNRLHGLLFGLFFKKEDGNLRLYGKVKFYNPAGISAGKHVKIYSGSIFDCSDTFSNKKSTISLGENVMIREFSIFRSHQGKISIGNNSFIGPHCLLQGPNLKIGNNVLIASGVKIFSSEHEYQDKSTPIKLQKESSKGILIEDDVWIGANSVITDGVTIKKGSIVGAGSVLTKSVPQFTVVAGNPANPIKNR